ncbi:MAG TPA: Smr/MutS family protein [Agitococcus sp.]|nr:Smr/MutS family protein [Agitococcus sp.]
MKNKLLADLKKTLVAEKIASAIPIKPQINKQVATQEHLTDEQLLAQAMKGVKPLQLEATAPIQTAKKLDDNTLLRRAAAEGAKEMVQEAISDTVALLNPVSSEAILSFRKIGIQQGLFKKLKDGHLPWRAAVDLHGCTVEQAREAVLQIIFDAQQEGITVIKIVHGKGYSQGSQGSLLKTCVNGWLQQHRAVLAFHSALAKDGGNGAVLVLLKKQQTQHSDVKR